MHNLDGKKYCRTCEIYFYHEGQFCPCCGMQLRTTPIDTKDKAKIKKRLQKQVIH
jgi:rRNA maturation endonuclease Nob1